jgi:hypothetical protein
MFCIRLRHGSNALDSSSSPERSSPVILSEAKDLATDLNRPFASLRVTRCDWSNDQGLVFTIEPCLSYILPYDVLLTTPSSVKAGSKLRNIFLLL